MERIIYLDNAATTFPKPVDVVSEIGSILRYRCGNPGRSGHKIAVSAAQTVYDCREKIASMFGGDADNVVFTSNATHAINLAIKTTLHRGDHVLISDIEHNSVLRPIAALAKRGLISYDIYASSENPDELLHNVLCLIRPNTAMVCANHHSNICSFITPIRVLGELCRRRGLIFLVDASQSAGVLPINMKKDCIDLLCAPGHKALYGPPGVGFTLFGDRFSNPEKLPDTFIEGGNGIYSAERFMPNFLPERLESGTLALPAIAGLSKGIDFVRSFPENRIHSYESELCAHLRKRLSKLDRIRFYHKNNGSVLLFSVLGCDSEEFASQLDNYGICVRAGLHCAPLAHKKLGTPQDGAIRVSFGAFNSERDVRDFASACENILKNMRIKGIDKK